MKSEIIKIIFAGLFLFYFSNNILGQGNLEFNQVRVFELEGIASNTNSTIHNKLDSIQISVPPGKVLKIEFANVSFLSQVTPNTAFEPTADGSTRGFIFLNDVIISPARTNKTDMGNFPIWLSSGTYQLAISGLGSSSNPLRYKGLVSAIEFNVSP
ncbi:MAG: hypothetical protein AAFW00_07245 [Bacteroidota bacterium]